MPAACTRRTARPATLTGLACHRKPVCPCELLPRGAPGLVSFNGSDYRLSYHASLSDEAVEVLGYRFVNAQTGACYDLDAEALACDCPDGTYRERPEGCKHALAVRVLRQRQEIA